MAGRKKFFRDMDEIIDFVANSGDESDMNMRLESDCDLDISDWDNEDESDIAFVSQIYPKENVLMQLLPTIFLMMMFVISVMLFLMMIIVVSVMLFPMMMMMFVVSVRWWHGS